MDLEVVAVWTVISGTLGYAVWGSVRDARRRRAMLAELRTRPSKPVVPETRTVAAWRAAHKND